MLAGGWAWASGAMVSTPAELNRFARGYIGGEHFDAGVEAQQRDFRAGSSEPTGPGENAAGLALFRYRTSCGVVLATPGTRSATPSSSPRARTAAARSPCP